MNLLIDFQQVKSKKTLIDIMPYNIIGFDNIKKFFEIILWRNKKVLDLYKDIDFNIEDDLINASNPMTNNDFKIFSSR